MRAAHETVGKFVAQCDSKKCRLADLALADLQSAAPQITADVAQVLGAKNAVAALQSYGSGGRKSVLDQLERWKERLARSQAQESATN